ncbi:MAG: Mu-like prophage major head subunit gpT family protein [Anaerotruncus massiliensis (ex Togo et al. 2019)]
MPQRAAMMGFFNSKGRPLKLVPNLLVVPPAGRNRALHHKERVYQRHHEHYEGTAEGLVVPDLAGSDTAWYLLRTTKPIKPLIYQERKKPKFVSKTGEQDDNVFFDKQYIYGVDSRGNAGFGFWQMGYGSDGTTGGE